MPFLVYSEYFAHRLHEYVIYEFFAIYSDEDEADCICGQLNDNEAYHHPKSSIRYKVKEVAAELKL